MSTCLNIVTSSIRNIAPDPTLALPPYKQKIQYVLLLFLYCRYALIPEQVHLNVCHYIYNEVNFRRLSHDVAKAFNLIFSFTQTLTFDVSKSLVFINVLNSSIHNEKQ